MFLHIGADVEIRLKDLVGIFDMKSMEDSKITTEFLKVAREEGFVCVVSKDDIKTIIITEEKGRNVVYLSPISSATLQKRIHLLSDLSIIN
ncbi:MAG: extracellular matrix regulatory protein [Epulopiscium sp.]|uniref:DUF370 domain-containing protein n=1 Tax=Defluviitalea raffinosedens TaxID=1450156 RepID=A0A7C8LNS0_9FIRM|nr:extracellular matrix/biofilm biosynthesis regulator RemA family protein [Defluviitalea raffinosedens]KAE9630261.1 DUF370 domain-containing protein [Defluviitalea raffinosedens]MBZ4667649.1 hypothetical protein [Defluviitaleaceae bacterium]MDK2788023.1 extracellular matrix regulatory protein [Candidatus Epulonipiscium sp.]